MKRLRILGLVCMLVGASVAQMNTAAGPKYQRTVSIENCQLDFEESFLSNHHKNDWIEWDPLGGEFVINFITQKTPCKDKGGNPRWTYLISGKVDKDACYWSGVDEDRYKYEILARNKEGKLQTCNDPAVIVVDSKMIGDGTAKLERKWPIVVDVGSQPLPTQRVVNIDKDCVPSGSPNLYVSKSNTLIWTADAGIFSIDFQGASPSPCLKNAPTASDPNPAERTQFALQDVCYVNPKAVSLNAYSYTITRADANCSQKNGKVFVRP